MIDFVCADCIEHLKTLSNDSVDLCVTSPPYNLDVVYGVYRDNLPYDDYLIWTDAWVSQIKRVLKSTGSFFLNCGTSSTQPWISMDVANVARKHFILQNHFIWVKSITVGEKSYGHFKPRNSQRFVNHCYEDIYHFTHTGQIPLDRLAVGTPFQDKSNINRCKHEKDCRCRGDVWYIPYKTIQSKAERGMHPASFPPELPEMCIKLHGVERCQLVLDPFCGVGNTAVACKKLKIPCLAVDIDNNYIDIAKDNCR